MRNFLTYLTVNRHVSASTQNQAQCALLVLAREILGLDVDGLSQTTRAKRGRRLPVVLSVPETAALLDVLRGPNRVMASLIYGGGLRISECCPLRFKDLDFANRATLLPESARDELQAHLAGARELHDAGPCRYIRSGTVSLRICSWLAATFDRFSSIWGTPTSRPPRYTPTLFEV